MTDSVTRFSSRVENYAKYRPGYPAAIIDILKSDCGLTPDSVIADVGCGTGILSRLFLENGNTVFGIEPNFAMRNYAERNLWNFNNFLAVEATAEATTLKPGSMDFVTAAQAFHWFDQRQARDEFARITNPRGWVVLIWNERRLDSSPFLRDYENLLLRYSTDYSRVRHEKVEGEIANFFAPNPVTHKSIENFQHFDFESLQGRTRSASYTPEPGDANFESLFSELKEIYKTHKKDGMVTVEYDTRVFYGRL